MQTGTDNLSIREKNLWFELFVDIGVALYYYPKAFQLILRGDEALRGDAMVSLITSTVILAIILSSALSILLHTREKPEPMDERDFQIAWRAGFWSHRVLVACILVLIGRIVVEAMLPEYQVVRAGIRMGPLVIAHLMLVALMLASMTSTAYKLLSYRRGY
jgi:hypothetical protein